DETRKNTIYDNQTQKFMQIHYCKNCNYSHECVTAWIEKKPDIEWNIIDKEKIYCETQSEYEQC
ncbi:MAG: hypothetical protein PHP82_03920, partial [Candidatus ainarchaeum sp.]|nr:hypothetical protein [Candidatus ainarchaeum sp.]